MSAILCLLEFVIGLLRKRHVTHDHVRMYSVQYAIYQSGKHGCIDSAHLTEGSELIADYQAALDVCGEGICGQAGVRGVGARIIKFVFGRYAFKEALQISAHGRRNGLNGKYCCSSKGGIPSVCLESTWAADHVRMISRLEMVLHETSTCLNMLFSVSSTHTDAILRTSGYRRKDFDIAVAWFPAREHAAVRASLLSTSGHSTASLGALDKLPIELINMTCLELDISSCFKFRHVNLRAQQVINCLTQYRIAITYSLNCFCAILRTKTASYVTLNDYYTCLCETTCSLFCLRDDASEVRMLTKSAARRILRLSSRMLKNIPTLTTLPGIYSMDERSYKRRYTITMEESALSTHRHAINGAEVRKEAHQPGAVLANWSVEHQCNNCAEYIRMSSILAV
nr:hypothetical protein CFP56_03290 [Quercus suber]